MGKKFQTQVSLYFKTLLNATSDTFSKRTKVLTDFHKDFLNSLDNTFNNLLEEDLTSIDKYKTKFNDFFNNKVKDEVEKIDKVNLEVEKLEDLSENLKTYYDNYKKISDYIKKYNEMGEEGNKIKNSLISDIIYYDINSFLKEKKYCRESNKIELSKVSVAEDGEKITADDDNGEYLNIKISKENIQSNELKLKFSDDNKTKSVKGVYLNDDKTIVKNINEKVDLFDLMCAYKLILDTFNKEQDTKKEAGNKIKECLKKIGDTLIGLKEDYTKYKVFLGNKTEISSSDGKLKQEPITSKQAKNYVIEKIEEFLDVSEPPAEGSGEKQIKKCNYDSLHKYTGLENVNYNSVVSYVNGDKSNEEAKKIGEVIDFIYGLFEKINNLKDIYNDFILSNTKWKLDTSEDKQDNSNDWKLIKDDKQDDKQDDEFDKGKLKSDCKNNKKNNNYVKILNESGEVEMSITSKKGLFLYNKNTNEVTAKTVYDNLNEGKNDSIYKKFQNIAEKKIDFKNNKFSKRAGNTENTDIDNGFNNFQNKLKKHIEEKVKERTSMKTDFNEIKKYLKPLEYYTWEKIPSNSSQDYKECLAFYNGTETSINYNLLNNNSLTSETDVKVYIACVVRKQEIEKTMGETKNEQNQ